MAWPDWWTTSSNLCHKSTFFTGCLDAVRQPRAFHPAIHSVMPLRTYSLSKCSTTKQGCFKALKASITAINSMRLLVVRVSPPKISFSRPAL
jgi:hypothetical protein